MGKEGEGKGGREGEGREKEAEREQGGKEGGEHCRGHKLESVSNSPHTPT